MDKKTFGNVMKSIFSIKGIVAVLIISITLGYLSWGFDVIPDKIPILGYVDDVLLIILGYFGVSRLIHKLTKGKNK